MRDLFVLSSSSAVTTLCILLLTNLSLAQVMSSANFQVQSDSVNFGGGYSSSTNYKVQSTGGEIATGESSSGSYINRAGYQQTHESYIALSTTGDIALSPAIPGISGGFSTGSSTVTVITDSLSGYELTIEAGTSPAMNSGSNTISDYTPATSDPDYTFTTLAADAHLGFSPEGVDIVQRYLDNGVSCNQFGGSDTVDTCWDGLSTSPTTIARSSGSNHPAGTGTTIEFQVGIGGSVTQPAGSYVATTTVTAIVL